MSLAQEDPIAFASAGALASSLYKASEYMFVEYQKGNVDEEIWLGQKTANRQFIAAQDFMKINWMFAGWQVALGFRIFIDDMIRDICSKQECPVGGRPEDWTELSA